MADTEDAARRARSEARRSEWKGERVLAGTPKPPLYSDLSLTERIEAMWRLCLAQWLAAHPPPVELPRSQWPGERFEIEAERGRPRE